MTLYSQSPYTPALCGYANCEMFLLQIKYLGLLVYVRAKHSERELQATLIPGWKTSHFTPG